jgi:dihydrofolate reductase
MSQNPKQILVKLILALDHSGVIGIKNGSMAWEPIPEDLDNFKRKTVQEVVVMGRNTWDSLPPKFKPLPKRRMNIVVTRGYNSELSKGIIAAGGIVCLDLGSVHTICAGNNVKEIWVIGGKEIYELFLDPNLDPKMFEVSSIHRTLVDGQLACYESGLALPQEKIQEFVRIPGMLTPEKAYPHLNLVQIPGYKLGTHAVYDLFERKNTII